MEYKNDKCEFTAFVKAGLDSKEQENIEICIERVTKTVKEDFLNAVSYTHLTLPTIA